MTCCWESGLDNNSEVLEEGVATPFEAAAAASTAAAAASGRGRKGSNLSMRTTEAAKENDTESSMATIAFSAFSASIDGRVRL